VTIAENHDDRGCHVALRGRLDVRTVADLRLTLHRLIQGGTSPVLLDLGEAHVGDATGFGLIVECLRRARHAGRPLRIVAADDRTRRLLRRARLGSLLGALPAVSAESPASVLAGVAG
jgi:anti-anti-sigma factor